ncbi:ATP synthase subunit I [Bacillus songklensis]|uniref:ATP synthase subunit I n=1 Tax=Bacillus songklensis TaxID=1069116 RepID=A0ABV8B8D1_9BACI
MQDIKQLFPRLRFYILFILALFVIGWGFTPYHSVFLGLILGTSFSLYNLWILARKQNKVGQAITEGKRIRSFGTFTRFAVAILAVMIAVEYPRIFHLTSVILGLMTSYIVIMIDLFIQLIRK